MILMQLAIVQKNHELIVLYFDTYLASWWAWCQNDNDNDR